MLVTVDIMSSGTDALFPLLRLKVWTRLTHADIKGYQKSVGVLVEADADVNIADDEVSCFA